MTDRRLAWQPGEMLCAREQKYRVEAVLGMGAGAIVYRVTYADGVSSQRHTALLKELYPSLEGVRRVAGVLHVEEDARDAFEHHRQSFLRGNDAHLRQLQTQAGRVSGNIDSFALGGTLYTLLEFQASQTLEQALALEPPVTAERAARRTLALLNALAPFHQEGLIHLDVSPDNLLLMPVLHGYEADCEPMLLIDYNSVWDRTLGGDPCFSSKAGYAAPEARLRNAQGIGEATDLFSVCAILFRMLTGRALTEAECCGQFLPGVCEAVETACKSLPQTAQLQAVRIIRKGLQPLPRLRFQTITELDAALRELLNRIYGKGVTFAALWEAARQSLPQADPPAHPLALHMVVDGRTLPADPERVLALRQPLLLQGVGGCGKTTLLKALHRHFALRYSPGEPACFYVPLLRWHGGEHFVMQCLTERLQPDAPGTTQEEMRVALTRLLSRALPDGRPCLLLLLDGLNETGARPEALFREIASLSRLAGVRVLITSRDVTDRRRLPDGFGLATLQPLDPAEVNRSLEERGLSAMTPPELRESLRNPLLLTLYGDTWSAWQQSGQSLAATDPDFRSPDALRRRYLEGQVALYEALHRDREIDCLRARYAVEHQLPALAAAMRTRPTLSSAEAAAVIRRDAHALRGRAFASAFPEYRGKSRLLMQDVQTPDEWQDLMVHEVLGNRLGLLNREPDGTLALLHESFREGLSREARALRRRLCKPLLRIVVIAAVCLALLVGAFFALRPVLPLSLTRAEQTAVLDLENAGYGALLQVNEVLTGQQSVRDALVAGTPAARLNSLLPVTDVTDAGAQVPWRKAGYGKASWETVLHLPQESAQLYLAALLSLSEAFDGTHSAEFQQRRLSLYDEFCGLHKVYILLSFYAAYADAPADTQNQFYAGMKAVTQLRTTFIQTAKPLGDALMAGAQRDAAFTELSQTMFYALAQQEANRWPDAAAMADALAQRMGQ